MAVTVFFSPEAFIFLRQLKRNNNREWFAKNKARYQIHIVEPALSFIGGFAPHLDKISSHFVADARPSRGSLFRIYRDTRFSPDKRPFKTHVGIHFSHSSGKDAHAPVFYLHLEPDSCFVVSGIWHPDNRVLTKVRTAFVRNVEQWAKVRQELTLEGDRLSRPPRGFGSNSPRFADYSLMWIISVLPTIGKVKPVRVRLLCQHRGVSTRAGQKPVTRAAWIENAW